MVFDKTKAMRNAERYLTQGKIRSAISEYKQVVENDPRDFGTMNMLGDLYTKASEATAAVGCYTSVAEHYSKQGFAQKAIAIYNKISKIQPNSLDISEKLAELYKVKGSLSEAKSHYVMLAENYQQRGRMVEALAMWKQIAILDPNNTEVFLTLAESYLKENQVQESVDAFAEAGSRLAKKGLHEAALDAYSRGMELQADNPQVLSGFVSSKFAMNRADEAAEKLSSILAEQPSNREVLFLLIDCYLAAGKMADAEKTVIKLVEQEPANYPKFLELANVYLGQKDIVSASRVLSMSSDHLLMGGQADDFAAAVNGVLEQNPEHLDGLRLRVRFCTWQRDEDGLRDSLKRLAVVAKAEDAVDDERVALSQLVMIFPQEVAYADRLQEINELHGFEAEPVGPSLFDKQFLKERSNGAVRPVAETLSDFAIVGATLESSNGNVDTVEFSTDEFEAAVIEDVEIMEPGAAIDALDDSPEARRRKECESIKFYIDNGYAELAQKAIDEFRAEFGNVPEVAELNSYLRSHAGNDASTASTASVPPVSTNGNGSKAFDIGEFRHELGLEESDLADDGDYDTHYHTAVAYQEMGLLEQAIAEFQDAINLVRPNDGTKRFFQCANLLGHCFMQNGMPKVALKWHHRTLETNDLNGDEKQAVWYELGCAYEAEGDFENANKFFEQVYTENVDYRDVCQRLKSMMATH